MGAGAGGAAGLGDLLNGVKAAARRIANFVTYYEMKQRAGTVGRTGLAPVLRQLRERAPAMRLHLVGHSFGGRLVTAAAHALPDRTAAVTMALLQAAFSHNGLASRFDGKNDGAFRDVMAQARISGPIVITHTKNDRAVGIAYPLASRLSRDQAAAMGDRDDPYGGMGRNGAQHMGSEAQDGDLLAVGYSYDFAPGRVFNLKADEFIKDHGDVAGEQVAYALLHVARMV
jgi:esterase/lipase superfamily enzyme